MSRLACASGLLLKRLEDSGGTKCAGGTENFLGSFFLARSPLAEVFSPLKRRREMFIGQAAKGVRLPGIVSFATYEGVFTLIFTFSFPGNILPLRGYFFFAVC